MYLTRKVFLQLLCGFFIFLSRARARVRVRQRDDFPLICVGWFYLCRARYRPGGVKVFLEVVWGGFIPGRARVLLPPLKNRAGVPFYGVSCISALIFSQRALSSPAVLIAWDSPDVSALSFQANRF